MRVLLTGAGGMLGSEIERVLSPRFEIFPLTRAELDIVSLEDVREIVDEARPELVIHCAAFTDVDRCELEPDEAYRINGVGARNVALACRERDAALVHISTDFVFDGRKTEPYIEYDPVGPISVYGASKLAGERYVRSFAPRHYIVRTAWLYGRHPRKTFIRTILEAAREKGEISVVADQIGSPTYTTDVARALIPIIETGAYGTYHLTNRGSCSRFEWAKEILRLAGVQAEVHATTSDAVPRPALRPANSSLRNLVAELTLGKDPMRNWREALADYLGSDLTHT